jgi:hypothetical protein
MALFFNRSERGNPGNPSAPKKWYLILKSLGLIKEKQIARQISDETTLNPKEAEIALSQQKKFPLIIFWTNVFASYMAKNAAGTRCSAWAVTFPTTGLPVMPKR